MVENIIYNDKELFILEKIHKSHDTIKQRDLAKIVGLSLGMTNTILKRLAAKGLLTIKKINNRNIVYAVSPLGIEEISYRSFNFFKRTIKNVVFYKEAVDEIIKSAKQNGFAKIYLVGKSDIDFIIEYICAKNHIDYFAGTPTVVENSFIIYSESIERDSCSVKTGIGCQYLKEIIEG
jgi:predicted transcriptional regulator